MTTTRFVPTQTNTQLEEMARALRILIPEGQVVELRVPKVEGKKGRTDSGYFSDMSLLPKAAIAYNRKSHGVYITPNPVNPALLARAVNRVQEWSETTTADSDIVKRTWFLIDADPKRPSNISSSDEEHEAALERVRKIRKWLSGLGWPEPVYADSGNGGHLLYRIDLPNNQDSTTLIQQCLQALSAMWDDAQIVIDTTVFNAARIWKLYGTVAGKGDHTPDRPHRQSRIIEVPPDLTPVPVEKLQGLAANAPTAEESGKRGTYGTFDLEEWLKKYDVTGSKAPWNGGTRWKLNKCPFSDEHTDGAFVVQLSNGAIAAGCKHNSCQGKNWKTLRELKEGTKTVKTEYKPKVYTNGHSQPQAEAQEYTEDGERRTYPHLLAELKEKAINDYDERTVIDCLFDGEEGDARLLDSILKNNIVYDHAEGLWYWFNNLHWEPDKTWNIYQLTSDILSDLYKHLSIQKHTESIEIEKTLLAKDNTTQEERDALKRIISISKAAKARSIKLNEIGEVKRVLSFACIGLRLGITGDEWDTKINLLGVQNGIIDLITGELVRPDPMAYIRTVASVTFDPEAKCPRWEKSILEIFDGNQEIVDYIQRLLGYAMSGTCVESDFPIWFGKDGRNGKEFLLERARNVLGDKLAGVVESELLLTSKNQRAKNSSTEGLMALRGRRIAWASETNEGRSLDLASMKDLSGGHILTGRHNHGRQVEWRRTHTLILLTNHRPHINSQSLAEWDRVKLTEFPLSFVNEPDPEKPNQRKKDKALGEYIDQHELPGIFNWLLDGCLAWRIGGLDEPELVKTATARYRQDEDALGHFVREVCYVSEEARTKPSDLYRHYIAWVDPGTKPMGKKTFYGKMEERGFRRGWIVGLEWFVGIGIKDQ